MFSQRKLLITRLRCETSILTANTLQVKQEALQAKQSMFNRHSTAEKALREHKELLTTAREELAGQKSLIETLRANAKNLRQQISAIKVYACLRCAVDL